MDEHVVEPAAPLWRIVLCVFLWCFFAIGAVFAIAGDLILQMLGVTVYNSSDMNSPWKVIYILGVLPLTIAAMNSGFRPVRASWWKRTLWRLSIIATVGMGVIPNKSSLMEIKKWQYAAETAPSAWLMVVFFAVVILTGKCLILFYFWRAATTESAKLMRKSNP